MDFILASTSPRRQQMLRDLGIGFKVKAPDVDETRLRGEPALAYVQRLAQEKAESVMKRLGFGKDVGGGHDWAILAADTIVVHGKLVLGKPENADDALKMLKKLSGRTHEVITAYCLLGSKNGKLRYVVSHVRTKVTFAEMSNEFIRWYVSTNEPMDKAGAYAAQGIGMSFIVKVSGSYSNVVGLPLPQIVQSFKKVFGEDLRECCAESR